MSTGLSALVEGTAVGRASVVARGVAHVPAANIVAFKGPRSGETIMYLGGEADAMPLQDLEWVHHKMTTGTWRESVLDGAEPH